MIAVLDRRGRMFARVWCVYELFLTLVVDARRRKGKEGKDVPSWGVYTARSHTYTNRHGRSEEMRRAVGIVSDGGATADLGNPSNTAARERFFPCELMNKSVGIRVERAVASNDADRVYILNSIVRGSTTGGAGAVMMNGVPPATHESYVAVNDAVRAVFASSVPALQEATKIGGVGG